MVGLRITNGPLAGTVVPIVGESSIGRAGADLVIDDAEVSRRHAIVRLVAGGVEVEDLGSTNGTLVDGRRIEGRVRLVSGARLTLGTTELELEAAAPAPSPSEPLTDFSLRTRPRRRMPATRSWVPTALSFGSAMATATALVLYFAAR
jgi:S-DNA-T family DNA segregation ATPase FtsK/SpoIIIE